MDSTRQLNCTEAERSTSWGFQTFSHVIDRPPSPTFQLLSTSENSVTVVLWACVKHVLIPLVYPSELLTKLSYYNVSIFRRHRCSNCINFRASPDLNDHDSECSSNIDVVAAVYTRSSIGNRRLHGRSTGFQVVNAIWSFRMGEDTSCDLRQLSELRLPN